MGTDGFLQSACPALKVRAPQMHTSRVPTGPIDTAQLTAHTAWRQVLILSFNQISDVDGLCALQHVSAQGGTEERVVPGWSCSTWVHRVGRKGKLAHSS